MITKLLQAVVLVAIVSIAQAQEETRAEAKIKTDAEAFEKKKMSIGYEVVEGRYYRAPKVEGQKRAKFPSDKKCKDTDFRKFHFCLQPRFFDPSARVYFDSGADDEGEIDLFSQGALSPNIDFAAIYVPWRLGRSTFYDPWSWGPIVGAGISAAAKGAEDGEKSSSAPVVLVTAGLLLEYKFDSGPSFGFEVGRAIGFTSDESFGDNDDSATYVGLKINVPLKGTKDKPEAAK